MSAPDAPRASYHRLETPTFGGRGKVVVFVDTLPEPRGHNWQVQVVHPSAQTRGGGWAPSMERAAIEAAAWGSAAAAGLERAEAILSKMVASREEVTPPHMM